MEWADVKVEVMSTGGGAGTCSLWPARSGQKRDRGRRGEGAGKDRGGSESRACHAVNVGTTHASAGGSRQVKKEMSSVTSDWDSWSSAQLS